jgi:hypothetical protein
MGRGSRDSHCSAHPLSRRAAGAPHTHAHTRVLAILRRARGAALTSRRRPAGNRSLIHAVVRIEQRTAVRAEARRRVRELQLHHAEARETATASRGDAETRRGPSKCPAPRTRQCQPKDLLFGVADGEDRRTGGPIPTRKVVAVLRGSAPPREMRFGHGARISPRGLFSSPLRVSCSYKATAHDPAIHSPGRVVAQSVRAGEVPRRSLVRASGRRIEGYLNLQVASSILAGSSCIHRRAWAWPRATGHRSSTAIHRARRRRTSTHGPRGRGGADTRRRDAGANPAGPGSTSHL